MVVVYLGRTSLRSAPPGVAIPSSLHNVPLVKSTRSSEQIQASLENVGQAIASGTEALITEAKRIWFENLSAAGVSLALAEFSGSFTHSKLSKADMIVALLEGQADVVSPTLLSTWATNPRQLNPVGASPSLVTQEASAQASAQAQAGRAQSVEAARAQAEAAASAVSASAFLATEAARIQAETEAARIQAEAAANVAAEAARIQADTEAARIQAEAAANVATEVQPQGLQVQAGVSPAGVAGSPLFMEQLQLAMAQNVAIMMESFKASTTKAEASSSPPPKTRRSAVEENNFQCVQRVAAGLFVEPARLGAPFATKLRESTETSKRSFIIGTSGVTERGSILSQSMAEEANAIRQGCDALLELTMMCEVQSVKDRLADRLSFNKRAWAMDFPFHSLAKFVRAFMREYHDSDNWCEWLKRDNFLIATHLTGPGARETRTHTPDSRAKKRSRGSPGGGGGKGGRGSGSGSSSQFCHSRVYQKIGSCKFQTAGKPCRFSHACASCGNDHPAKDCPSFDKTKAEAAYAATLRP